ncbi:MAG: hypothetical protein ABSE89_01850 [Sedimentisphaerales bacterium]
MKKLIVLTIMAAMFFAGVSKAQEPNAPKQEPNAPKFNPNMFRGRIVVTKDANGIITSVKLENRRRGTFNIVLDEKGKELAEKMADKFVEITGKETTKDNEKWLTVENYSEMERPPMGRHHPDDPNNPGRRVGPRED